MKAYNLLGIKDEEHYIKNGFTQEQAEDIVREIWDDDEVFTSKREYIANARLFSKQVSKKLGYRVDWRILYGEPQYEGLEYCHKCGEFYWSDDYHDCE